MIFCSFLSFFGVVVVDESQQSKHEDATERGTSLVVVWCTLKTAMIFGVVSSKPNSRAVQECQV